MQLLYILLCVAGAALPLSQFIPWLLANGLDLPRMLRQAAAEPIAAFAWADVLVSGAAVAVFIVVEGGRIGMRRLGGPLACLAIGPSLALPFLLLLRERHLAAGRAQARR